MPRTSCGAPIRRSGVHGGIDVHGAGSSPHVDCIGTPSVSAGMSAIRGDRFAAPAADLHGAMPGCMARPRPARLGGWPCGWPSRLPKYDCRTTSRQLQIRSSGASSRPTPSSPSPSDQRRRRAVCNRTLIGIRSSMSLHLPTTVVGAAGRRPRLRRTGECPVDRRKERLPEPRSSSSGVARRDLNQARRVRQDLGN